MQGRRSDTALVFCKKIRHCGLSLVLILISLKNAGLTELNSKIPVAITRLDDGSTDYTYDCYYYPAVGMCVLNLTVNPRVSKTYEAGTTYSLYEIEAGFRPARSISLACYSSGSGVSNCAINSAGAVRYQPCDSAVWLLASGLFKYIRLIANR